VTLAAAALACAAPPPGPEPAPAGPERAAPVPPVPVRPPEARHGAVVGDAGPTHAWLWSRAEGATRMEVALREAGGDGGPTLRREAPVDLARDQTARLRLDGLRPGTWYRYALRFVHDGADPPRAGPALAGAFRTAPAPETPAPVRLAFGGDVAGQNVCRDAERGFPIFRVLRERTPDVFVALGDMIYADGLCEPTGLYGNAQVPGGFGPAADRAAFHAHWRYARADDALADLLRATSSIAVWDDHEVVNDAGPHQDTREAPPYRPGEPLLPIGLAAFLDYNPVEGDGAPLYRSLRWGRHLELFVLDTRSHRDPNVAPDTRPLPKTLLGAAQREWLLEGLSRSDATWKVVVSSVPISIPTGVPEERGRDGWADYDQDTGFERELRAILRTLQQRGVSNLVWITTDVHFAAVFRYTPFDTARHFHFHEIATGPMNAGIFPKDAFDTSLGTERLFLYGPEDARAVDGFEEALHWFNFGELDVDAAGRLTARIVNGEGRVVWEAAIPPG
jgi:alkaline phosphatase D